MNEAYHMSQVISSLAGQQLQLVYGHILSCIQQQTVHCYLQDPGKFPAMTRRKVVNHQIPTCIQTKRVHEDDSLHAIDKFNPVNT